MKVAAVIVCVVSLSAHDSSGVRWERLVPFGAGTITALTVSHIAQARHYWKTSVPFYVNSGADAGYAAGADKFGHAMAAYATTILVREGLVWSGVDTTVATLVGAATALINQTLVEYRDATSVASSGADYPYLGWSWGDVAANVAGAALPVAQQLWGERLPLLAALRYKYSIHSSGNVERGLYRSIFDDYESQYHWLCLPLSALIADSSAWWLRSVGVAIGHSVRGIVADGGLYTYSGKHEIWLALDYNLEAIPTDSPLLRSVLRILNLARLPSPCIRLIPNAAVFGFRW